MYKGDATQQHSRRYLVTCYVQEYTYLSQTLHLFQKMCRSQKQFVILLYTHQPDLFKFTHNACLD